MKAVKITCIVASVLCIGCEVAFQVIGSWVDKQGILHEPFYLVGLGLLFALIAAITGIIWVVSEFKTGKRNKQRTNPPAPQA